MLDYLPAGLATAPERVARTVGLLERRGYALSPSRLADLCLGGPVSERDVRWTAAAGDVQVLDGLVVSRAMADRAAPISARARGHVTLAASYIAMTQRFVSTLIAFAPFIRSVWIAGSLASGGFRETDDVDLNLIVDDGHRHLAYVAVNVLGIAHALAHRSKPVDDLTRRPIAPRLMTANLILERSQLHPLARTDEGMAFELLMSEPVFGPEVYAAILDGNPALLEHFPQLARKHTPHVIEPAPRPRLPGGSPHPPPTVPRACWGLRHGATCSGPDATARRRSRASRSCARRCAPTRCSTAERPRGDRNRAPGRPARGDEPAASRVRCEPALSYLARHATADISAAAGSFSEEALVCVQIPVYNERYVAERVIDAVCEIDWPRPRFEVQVLDDSDDETVGIVAARVARWRRRGTRIAQIRRGTREGFKAGALAHGLNETGAPFIAIFDADFVPAADFLRRTMGVFADPRVGFAQARWGHLDEGYSWFTRLQALAIDFHFLVEQAVRSAHGYFTNFTGTAGVWRRSAIEDAGGWSAETLTEDLDLSYRAQLRGWRAAYLEDLVVPEELPVSIDAYRRQQSRWATGSFQAAFALLIPVLRSDNRLDVKLQASIHLLAYSVGPLMLLQLLCYPWLLITSTGRGMPWMLATAAISINLIGASPWIGFMVAQTRRGRTWWSGAPSLLCQVIGAGMSFTVICAFIRATRRGGTFIRTPKYRIVRRGQEWRDQAYVRLGDPRVIGEAALGLGALALVPASLGNGRPLIAIYSSVFALGFLSLAALTFVELLEVFALRNLGRRALQMVREASPVALLLAVAGALLVAAMQVPMPFEDGYAHWLIAANLAATGHLHDPLFGMEDTWLPGYHLLAAGVLKAFGLWSIDALRLAGVAMGVATLALVYRMAPNRRQGRTAIALLALNPVFLFTSSEIVAEPLMTALLTGATLAALRSRWKTAALLAALACTTSTKAWIFVAIGGVMLLPSPAFRERVRVRAAASVFAVPVLALIVLMPFASNSLARGAQEVLSATARGSVSGSALSRVTELISTFGLAALPLFALGAVGVVVAIRHPNAPLIRFAYAPASVYLAAVVALVAAGDYTGSHRYLYPALPALALLAASALDRQPVVTRIATAAATGLLAVAFLPVFAGFAGSNQGLVTAGLAASGSPGRLVTDSPVVAYFSHKAPDLIIGSQTLPPDRTAALAWIRAHGVTEMVVEDISYYRATVLFPDLASGTASPPFEPLGDQAAFQAPGGKVVYAYRLGAALDQQVLFPGVDAAIRPTPQEGKTAPLAKGVTLIVGGQSAAGEGMGFGVPIVHYVDGWVYPRTVSVVDLSSGDQAIWQCVFQLDEIGGDAPHDYAFAPIASRGTIQVTYTVDSSGISVVVKPLSLQPGYSQVAILNEESAAFNDVAGPDTTLVDSHFGRWVPMDGDWARLRSGSLGVEWSLSALTGAQLYAGRELSLPGFDWSGLDYVFNKSFTGAAYHINVQQAR